MIKLNSPIINFVNVNNATRDMRCESNNNFHIATAVADTVTSGGTWIVNTAGTSSGWAYASDIRLKCNIQPLPPVLEKVIQLNPVSFNFKTHPLDAPPVEGFIAQEVETIFPTLVSETTLPNYDFRVKGIAHEGFIPYIVKSIQERQEIINEQKMQIKQLFAEIEETEKTQQHEIDQLIAEIEELKSKLPV